MAAPSAPEPVKRQHGLARRWGVSRRVGAIPTVTASEAFGAQLGMVAPNMIRAHALAVAPLWPWIQTERYGSLSGWLQDEHVILDAYCTLSSPTAPMPCAMASVALRTFAMSCGPT